MCGFFAFATGRSGREIADLFHLTNLPKNYDDIKSEIESLKHYPKSLIPTISKNSPNQLVLRYWSLIPRWWHKPLTELKFSTFNARAEEISQKATYRAAWKDAQRCLIPATWFYEFQAVPDGKKTSKVPYRVQSEQDEIMTLAGLYESWQDAEGKNIDSVTIITCQAEGTLASIHARQPVIIKKDDRESWLTKATALTTIEKFLQPEPHLAIKQIDQRFNKSFGGAVTSEMVGMAGK